MSKAKDYIVTHQKTHLCSDDASKLIANCFDHCGNKGNIADKTSLLDAMSHYEGPGLSIVQLSEEMAQYLRQHEGVANIIEDFEFSLPRPDYSRINRPKKVDSAPWDWNIRMVNAGAAWKDRLTGNGVKIAVIDTGIDTINQPTLAPRVLGGVSYASGVESKSQSAWQDNFGHGTLCAAIMATPQIKNEIVGIAQNAALYSVKITDSQIIKLSNLVKGMGWVISECEKGNAIHIASMSVGIDLSDIITGQLDGKPAGLEGRDELKRLVQSLVDLNCCVIAPVGNDGSEDGGNQSVTYPARFNNVIGAGAVDMNGKWWGDSSWTKGENWVNITAPGVHIFSGWPGANPDLLHDGTCFSCAHISGGAALIIEHLNTIGASYTPEMVITALQEGARDIGRPGRDSKTGFGTLDCGQSLAIAKKIPSNNHT